jgi:hypothetical protein
MAMGVLILVLVLVLITHARTPRQAAHGACARRARITSARESSTYVICARHPVRATDRPTAPRHAAPRRTHARTHARHIT